MIWASSGSISSSRAICSLERFSPHEVQAQDPDPQRLMVAREDGPAAVIDSLAAGVALVHDPNAIAPRGTLTMPPEHPTRPMHRPQGPVSTPPPARPSVERDGGFP